MFRGTCARAMRSGERVHGPYGHSPPLVLVHSNTVSYKVRVGATTRRTLKRNLHFDPLFHLFNYISILQLKVLKFRL